MISQIDHSGNGRREGERRKAEALAMLADVRERYVNRARRALLIRCLDTGSATADDVRRAVELPKDIDPRCLGSVPGPLARKGIIRRTDFAKSNRPERHASFISTWILADADGAREWLRTHPDRPDPPADDGESAPESLFEMAHTKPDPTGPTVGSGR